MSNALLIGEPRPWYAVGRTVGGNPFVSLGLDYCPRCKDETDTDTDAVHSGDTYAYRRRCLRCGKVIKFGAYQVALVSDVPLPKAALEWTVEPGKDRR